MKNNKHGLRIRILLLLIVPWMVGCLLFASQISDTQEPRSGIETTVVSPTPTPTPIPEPAWTFYRNEELHPTEDEANLVFDQQGYLWVTGYGGVMRWDLTAKAYINYTQADGVSAAILRSLVIDSNNVPWIATDEEIQKFNGESWESFKKPSSGITKDFAEGGDGKLWLCALDGVFSFEAGNWVRYGTHNGLIADQCGQMTIGLDGNPWVITQKNSLSHFSQGWINYEVAEALLLENEIIFTGSGHGNIHIAPNGDVWVDQPFWVIRFDGKTWNIYRLPEKDGIVSAFGLSSSGTPWLAQRYQYKTYFREFNGTDWPVIMNPSYVQGLPTELFINGAVTDPDGAVWFIGPEYFIRTMQHGWTVYRQATVFYEWGFWNTVTFSPDGIFYYAGSEGILELGENPDDIQVYGNTGQLVDNYIRDIQFDAQGLMWVWQKQDTDFAFMSSLQTFDGQHFETFADLSMFWYLVARDGSLWVRVNNLPFLEFWDGNEWYGYGGNFGDESDMKKAGLSWLRGIRHIAEDDQGQIWASYEYDDDYGVAVWDGATWKRKPQFGYPDYPGGSYDLGFSSDGVLWVTSDFCGVSYLADDTWKSIKIPESLLKDEVEDNYWNIIYPIQFNNHNQPILLFFDPRERIDPALFEMRDYSWSRVPIRSFVQTILYHSNIFWVGTKDNGLYYRLDSETAPGSDWVHLDKYNWLGGSQVSLVAAGKGDDVWVVTEIGLALFDGVEWNYFPYEEVGISDVAVIRVAPDGTVWFGSTTQGLASYWTP
ncbi:MAG: hypothetical protein ABIJ65_01865 [Chloroflexota bacterium]